MTTIHILTACSRKENLKILKKNIEEANSTHKIYWHICFDTNFITPERYPSELKEEWIYLYSATTHFYSNPGKSQINFITTHFKLGLFSGYIYVLDDDNLLPPDIFKYDYNEEESLIYIYQQTLTSGETRGAVPKKGYIDQAQILIHSDIQGYYPLSHAGDGEFIEKICKEHPYKVMDNIIVPYNKIPRKVTFVITFANESINQLDWCLGNLRTSYKDDHVILISDGNTNPEYKDLCQKYNAVYVLSESLKRVSCGALWWKRFFTESLKTSPDFIFKIDPDTGVWKRISLPDNIDFFGTIINKGEDEHIQGGCQGFSRIFANKIIKSKITEDERFKDQDYWAVPNIKNWLKERPDYFSTDWSMMRIARELNIARYNHPEIWSSWQETPPENSNLKYAVTHPYKIF